MWMRQEEVCCRRRRGREDRELGLWVLLYCERATRAIGSKNGRPDIVGPCRQCPESGLGSVWYNFSIFN
jgi:hypothetical protein